MGQADKRRAKIFDGRYEILSIVGRGSCSVVYHARHIAAPFGEVALKVLLNRTDQRGGRNSTSDRLRKEALAMVSSRHRYVVRLDDFHSIDGLSYLSMEYAPLGDLAKFARATSNRLQPAQALRFFVQTVRALDFIHKAGIIHRDIKPDNILVVDQSQIRVADFGLALLPGEECNLDELAAGVGTMSYMAPEVLEGVRYDQRSDMYSLGVTFYELLSGSHPFEHAPLVEQLNVRRSDRITSITKLAPSITPKFAQVLHRLMEYEPQSRYDSLGEVLLELDQLDEALQDEPQKPASRERQMEEDPLGFLAEDSGDDEFSPLHRASEEPENEGVPAGKPLTVAPTPQILRAGRPLMIPQHGVAAEHDIDDTSSQSLSPVSSSESLADDEPKVIPLSEDSVQARTAPRKPRRHPRRRKKTGTYVRNRRTDTSGGGSSVGVGSSMSIEQPLASAVGSDLVSDYSASSESVSPELGGFDDTGFEESVDFEGEGSPLNNGSASSKAQPSSGHLISSGSNVEHRYPAVDDDRGSAVGESAASQHAQGGYSNGSADHFDDFFGDDFGHGGTRSPVSNGPVSGHPGAGYSMTDDAASPRAGVSRASGSQNPSQGTPPQGAASSQGFGPAASTQKSGSSSSYLDDDDELDEELLALLKELDEEYAREESLSGSSSKSPADKDAYPYGSSGETSSPYSHGDPSGSSPEQGFGGPSTAGSSSSYAPQSSAPMASSSTVAAKSGGLLNSSDSGKGRTEAQHSPNSFDYEDDYGSLDEFENEPAHSSNNRDAQPYGPSKAGSRRDRREADVVQDPVEDEGLSDMPWESDVGVEDEYESDGLGDGFDGDASDEESRRGLGGWLLAAAAVLVLGIGALLWFRGEPTPGGEQTAAVSQDDGQAVEGSASQSPFPELPAGTYVGAIDVLLGVTQVPLVIVVGPGSEFAATVYLGIEGSLPAPAKVQRAGDRVLRVDSSGMVLLFQRGEGESMLRGMVTDVVTGERARWSLEKR